MQNEYNYQAAKIKRRLHSLLGTEAVFLRCLAQGCGYETEVRYKRAARELRAEINNHWPIADYEIRRVK